VKSLELQLKEAQQSKIFSERSLVVKALLRPGRFEVQLEVPPPRTIEQRMSILSIHTKGMYEAGRVLVSDPPLGTAADRYLKVRNRDNC
jgi:SpoVK/Ycf46/Vps4 family AAA+-type ATPase